MFSLFRRRARQTEKFVWVPAVDANDPRVLAALLTFYNR